MSDESRCQNKRQKRSDFPFMSPKGENDFEGTNLQELLAFPYFSKEVAGAVQKIVSIYWEAKGCAGEVEIRPFKLHEAAQSSVLKPHAEQEPRSFFEQGNPHKCTVTKWWVTEGKEIEHETPLVFFQALDQVLKSEGEHTSYFYISLKILEDAKTKHPKKDFSCLCADLHYVIRRISYYIETRMSKRRRKLQ